MAYNIKSLHGIIHLLFEKNLPHLLHWF